MRSRTRPGMIAQLIALLLALSLVAVACGGDDDGDTTGYDGEVAVGDDGDDGGDATTDNRGTGRGYNRRQRLHRRCL